MRFSLLDKIVALEPGVRITASKLLRPEEEYLKDHFPRFAVMPGVLMLEAMYQASAWLIRQSEDFEHAGVVLKEARNVKYSDFVTPGKELVVTAEILKQDESTTTLKTQGTIDGNVAVAARLVVERFHVADKVPTRAECDPYARNKFREFFKKLVQTETGARPGAPVRPHALPGQLRLDVPTSVTR
jgi:3-hydroxyacyl-[acyl-carrier-protein] dehydratase